MRTGIRVVTPAAATLLLLACAPEIPEGVLLCDEAEPKRLRCPPDWFCHSNMRCYSREQRSSDFDPVGSDADVDTGADSPTFADAGDEAGMDAALDAALDAPSQAAFDAGPLQGPGVEPLFDADAPLSPDGAAADAPRDATSDRSDAEPPEAAASAADGSDPTPPPPPATCATADSGLVCDDSKFCNGSERCAPAEPGADARGCVAGAAVVCPDGQTCSELTMRCSSCMDSALDDADGDGYESAACAGLDCDDTDATRNPARAETCDGKDNNCDGAIDGAVADALCLAAAPAGASSSCVNGSCAPRCSDPDHDLISGVCTRRLDCPSADPCAPGMCVDGVRAFSCQCPSGYAGSGSSACVDIDECATGTHDCDASPAAVCVNTPGAYSCTCPPNATGSGRGADGCTAIPPPVDCTSTWVPAAAWGVIPSGAPIYTVMHKSEESTTHNQYLCRVATPDGSVVVPGKVNGGASNSSMFEWGCYGAYLDAGTWKGFGADMIGARFEVYVPPPQCGLDWVTVTPGAALPANALRVSQEPSGAALFTCRISTNDAKTSGAHLGRTGGAAGNTCVVQYFSTVYVRDMFDVLVQRQP